MKKDTAVKFYSAYKLYLFPLIISLSCLILILFVIYPQVKKLLTNQKVEGEIFKRSKFLETKAENLETYESEDLKNKINYVLGSYPLDKDYAQAVGLIQNLTSQAGFSILSLSLGSVPESKEGVQSYSIRLDIAGPMNLLMNLLSIIESSPRLMRVSSLETTLGKAGVATISMNVDILYSSAPGNLGSVDSPIPELSEKDQDVLAKLVRVGGIISPQTTTQLGPRGKANPFE